jgi:outer membrane protein W
MNRILSVVASLLLAATSFGQTNAPADTSGPKIWDANKQAWVTWNSAEHKSWPEANETMTPAENDWTFSAGAVYVRDTVRLAGSASSTGNAYGGYIASERFVSRAVSIRGEFIIINNTENINTPIGSASVDQTEFIVDLGAKFYPLQLTDTDNFRLQPYVRGAMGGIFYDDTIAGVSVNIDPALIVAGGGGLDFVLALEWTLNVEVDYYDTVTESTASIAGISATVRHYGILGTAGLRYRF